MTTPAPWAPAWVPDSGIQLREAGTDFDAVRIANGAGEDAAETLCRLTAHDPGPIVLEHGGRWTYFLLPPGTARSRAWPESVRLCVSRPGGATYVGVPALTGPTWPLGRRTVPTPENPYVCPYLLELATRAERL